MSGRIDSLTDIDRRGATLASAVAAVDTVLTVGDTADFEEDTSDGSYWLRIADSEPLEYVAVDHDAGTVTLAGAAGAVFEAGDPVDVWDPSVPPAGATVVEYLVSVMTDRGPVDAVIDHETVAFAGVDNLAGASVTLAEDYNGDLRVDKILGRQPSMDLSNADASTFDTSTLPPVPGGQTISDVAPTDVTGYPEDYGWWQVVDGEVLGFWRLVAGVWTSQAVVTMEALQANNVLVEALDGVTVTGVTVQTRGEPERGFKAGYIGGVEGLFVYNNAGVPFLKAVPEEGMAVIAGEVKANSLTVAPASAEEGTSLSGVTEIVRHADGTAGVLRLTGYTTPPKSAPTVTTSYDTVQFTDDGQWGDRYGLVTDGTYWYTGRTGFEGWVEKWDASGAFVADDFTTGAVFGVAYHAGNLYALCRASAGGGGAEWKIEKFSTPSLTYVAQSFWNPTDGSSDPTLGVDSATGDLLIAQSRVSTGGKVRISRFTFNAGGNLTAGATVDSSFAYDHHLAAVTYGTHDLGTNRYVFTARETENTFKVVDSTGTAVAAEDWQAPAKRVGFAYTGGAFKTIDFTGDLRTFTGQDKATAIGHANLTKYVSNTLATATLETTQSPRAKITIPKRSKINVTTSAINTGGTNAPDRVHIYIAQNTATPAADPGNTNMILQADPAVGVITKAYSAIATSPDTNPPTVNGFAAAAGTVQQVQLADESVFLDGVGGPAWKTTWTPAWTTTGTAPAIGNGTLTGRYQRIGGNTIAFSVQLTAGSTTTFGTGSWRFNFPVAELARRWAFQGTLRDASAAADFDAAVVRVSSGVLQVNCDPTTAGASTRGVTNAIPFAWGDGDILFFSGVFEVA